MKKAFLFKALVALCVINFSLIKAGDDDPVAGNRKRGRENEKEVSKVKRSRLYEPSADSFKISRSKIELFLNCQRCFYLDRRRGVKRPDGYPFSLNNAVDELLKKEFDTYREKQEPHPICVENEVDAVPFKHEDIEKWRNSLYEGVQYPVPGTNIILQGGLDDVWRDRRTQELMVVDYKATSKKGAVSLDADWQKAYKRQVEVYQWLLRKNGFNVSKIAYFVYCNGRKNEDGFDKKLVFDVSLIPHEGDDSWVEETVREAHKCLQQNSIPTPGEHCDYCRYYANVNRVMQEQAIHS